MSSHCHQLPAVWIRIVDERPVQRHTTHVHNAPIAGPSTTTCEYPLGRFELTSLDCSHRAETSAPFSFRRSR
jgi:hypothetical protein